MANIFSPQQIGMDKLHDLHGVGRAVTGYQIATLLVGVACSPIGSSEHFYIRPLAEDRFFADDMQKTFLKATCRYDVSGMAAIVIIELTKIIVDSGNFFYVETACIV